MRKLRESLPGFVAYLLKLRVPSDLADPRFGVKAWHDTGLLESLGELSPESRLVNLIDQVIFAEGADAVQWEGSAELLEKALRQSSFAWAVEKLLSFSSACGVYLARLAARMPERFACSMVRGKKRWKLKPPRAD
jgi:hypothetical protein